MQIKIIIILWNQTHKIFHVTFLYLHIDVLGVTFYSIRLNEDTNNSNAMLLQMMIYRHCKICRSETLDLVVYHFRQYAASVIIYLFTRTRPINIFSYLSAANCCKLHASSPSLTFYFAKAYNIASFRLKLKACYYLR